MNRIHTFVLALLLVLNANVSFSEVVKFTECDAGTNDDQCEIHSLEVNPCKEAASNDPCILRKDTRASMKIEFTPKFSSDFLKAGLWWTSLVDLPFVGMEPDACKTTTCPLVANERRSYTFDVDIKKAYPKGGYTLKWEGKGDDKKCCAIFKIKIQK